MIVSTRSNSYRYMLLLFIAALTLALAWPAVASAQPPPGTPESPPVNPGGTPGTPGGPGAGGPPSGGGGGNGGGGNGGGDNGNGGTTTPGVPPGPPGPDPGGPPTMPDDDDDDDDDDMSMMGPPAHELANRIVKHVATPVQLVISGDGFQFFFIGADGSTVSGPTFPSFAELAEMHPSGEWVSLLSAVNPLTFKQVYVDYIPKDMTIRVFTYYPDKGMDVDKQYIFNFGADLNVNVEAW